MLNFGFCFCPPVLALVIFSLRLTSIWLKTAGKSRQAPLRREPLSMLQFLGGVPTTPDPNTSAKASRYKWEAYRDPILLYYFLPMGGLLHKYRDRNGRCIAILFRSIGVRGRCDSPEFPRFCTTLHDFPQVSYTAFPISTQFAGFYQEKASAEIRGEFVRTNSRVNFAVDFLVDFLGPFSLK